MNVTKYTSPSDEGIIDGNDRADDINRQCWLWPNAHTTLLEEDVHCDLLHPREGLNDGGDDDAEKGGI